jgi:predicted Zn-ribbon and HTH transcriptional regulator
MPVEQLVELERLDDADDDLPPDHWDDDDDDGGGDSGPWVTVATFWQSPEAHIARLKLESEAIDCAIVDENLVATDWLFANAVGGIKLQVPLEQAPRARQLLQAKPDVAADSGEPMFDGQQRCPRCGSDDLFTPRFSRRVAFLCILLLGLPIPFLSRNRRCGQCGFEWRPVDFFPER